MRCSVLALFPLFLSVAVAAPTIGARDDDDQPRLCPRLNVKGGGCIRYVQGFDVTGVTTEIDLTFPEVKTKCECVEECLKRKETCNNYVWKFSTPESVQTGYRTCTLCPTPISSASTNYLQTRISTFLQTLPSNTVSKM